MKIALLKFEISLNMREIKLSNSSKIINVDDEDYDRVVKCNWNLCQSKSRTIDGINTISIGRTYWTKNKSVRELIGNFILGTQLLVDHKDRNVLNNVRENLRIATPSQNTANRMKSWGKNKYKGVFKDSNRYQVKIMKEGKRYFVGSFISEEDAARAYDKKARELFGEFAVLNFA